ncbi:MAG: MarR family transcriptional regulator [Candidatus Peregrinibacteria bacterium]|nr:MarR family transcriptional regulator [Candidatus Peregrinibacteria bacterium]
MTTRKQQIENIVEGMRAIKQKMVVCHVKKSSSRKEKNTPITPSQWAVMTIVMEKKGLGIKEIAEKLEMTSSAATQLVDGLVENGYLKRKNNTTDRRAILLEISPKHAKKMNEIKEKAIERFTTLFGALNDKELATYIKLQKKIINTPLSRNE